MKKAAALLVLAAILCGCPAKAPSAPPTQGPVSVTIAMPVVKKAVAFVQATGMAQAMNRVDVVPQVKGLLDTIYFKDGQHVRGPHKPTPDDAGASPDGKEIPGDLLYLIDPRPFEAARDKAKADLDLAIAAELVAEKRLASLEEAYKGNAVAELDVLTQRATVEQAKAQVESQRATLQASELNVEWAHVRSPIDGVISRTRVTVGNLVGDGPLATIVQEKPIYVYFPIADRDYLEIIAAHGGIRNGAEKVPLEVGLANEAGYVHKGFLDYEDPFVDSKTGTVTIRGVMPNEDGALIHGIFVRGRIPLAAQDEAVLVNERAVGTDQGQKYVLVVNKDNKVEYRAVTLGPPQDGLRVVATGLKADERVLVSGLLRVKTGAVVDPKLVEMPVSGAAAVAKK